MSPLIAMRQGLNEFDISVDQSMVINSLMHQELVVKLLNISIGLMHDYH